MPIVAVFFGMVIRIYHSDHPPPHFHVEYGEMHAVIEIRTGRVLHGKLPARLLRHIREWRRQRITELNRAWNMAQMHRALHRIDPLE